MKNLVEETLSFLPNVRVSVACQMDPERAAVAPKYNVHTTTEEDANQVESHCKFERNWKVVRSGPFLVHIDPSPNFKNDTSNLSYSSVWDD